MDMSTVGLFHFFCTYLYLSSTHYTKSTGVDYIGVLQLLDHQDSSSVTADASQAVTLFTSHW